jgi:hypothetical protein
MKAVLSVRWKCSTNSVAGDGGRLSRIAKFHSIWPEWKSCDKLAFLVGGWLEGRIQQFWLCCLGWGWLPASAWSGRLQWGSMWSPLTERAPWGLCGKAPRRIATHVHGFTSYLSGQLYATTNPFSSHPRRPHGASSHIRGLHVIASVQPTTSFELNGYCT